MHRTPIERKTLRKDLAPYHGKDKTGAAIEVPRHVDIAHDLSEIVQEMLQIYGTEGPNSTLTGIYRVDQVEGLVSSEELDAMIERSLPKVALEEIDSVIKKGRELAAEGTGEKMEYPEKARQPGVTLPPFEKGWRRALVLSWAHSRDMEILMDAMGRLGSPGKYYGRHDIHEEITAAAARTRLSQSEPWYLSWISGLSDEDRVDVGFFNPRISAILYKYGFDKNAPQNGLDGHRLTSHHLGNAEEPIDWIERGVNFVYHHLPREHMGILQRPQRGWEMIENEIAVSHLTKYDTILHDIIRDTAALMRRLERAGLIMPWHLLDTARESKTPGGEAPAKTLVLPVPSPKQVVASLRHRSFEGVVELDPDRGTWTQSGGAGWRITQTNESDPVTCQIEFVEPLIAGYTIQVTPLSRGSALISEIECAYAGEDGFRVLIDTVGERLTGPVGFSFFVHGLAKILTPDDRRIPSEQLIEDVHALANIFRHEVEFGVVTVMASASLKSAAAAKADFERRTSELAGLLRELEAERDPLVRRALEGRIEFAQARRDRAERIVAGVPYYESARRFGETWGRYCAVEQEKELGGRYVPLCTGGGPGLMEAAASGASSAKNGEVPLHPPVVAIDTLFEDEQRHSLKDDPVRYSTVRVRCNDFSLREMALINYAHVILFWPGGFGTTWEVFETLSKLQTKHLRRRRIKAILVHTEFWRPLVDLIEHFRSRGTINSYDDQILMPGDPAAQRMSYDQISSRYVAEVVDSEKEAYEAARRHLRYLYERNELSVSG